MCCMCVLVYVLYVCVGICAMCVCWYMCYVCVLVYVLYVCVGICAICVCWRYFEEAGLKVTYWEYGNENYGKIDR